MLRFGEGVSIEFQPRGVLDNILIEFTFRDSKKATKSVLTLNECSIIISQHRRTFYAIATLALCLLYSPGALADRGDMSVGFGLGGGYPQEGRVLAHVDLGLSQWFAARLSGGAAIELSSSPRTEGLADLGIVWAYDVLQWVPILELIQGVRFDDQKVDYRAGFAGGIRYYVARLWGFSISLGVELTIPEQFWGTFKLTIWRVLP